MDYKGIEIENGKLIIETKWFIRKTIDPNDIESFSKSGMMGTWINFKNGDFDIFLCFPEDLDQAIESMPNNQ